MLDTWPELPIYIHDLGELREEARDDVAAALKLNHRVSGIRLEKASFSAWETLGSLMRRPFPALTHLWVRQPFHSMNDLISRSFLGGSTPSLRVLLFNGVSFPALPDLLLSAPNLVYLFLHNIPPSGYISPQAMVTVLSALTRLKSLSLTFSSSQPLPDGAIRTPPSHTRPFLRSLTFLRFQGDPEYMEDLVAQMDAPLLGSMEITLFHREVLEVSELAKFVRRADRLSLVHRAEVTFGSFCISVTLSRNLRKVGPKTLMLKLACPESDLQLSYLAHFCASCLPTLCPFESLHILVPPRPSKPLRILVSLEHAWIDVMDHPDPQWLELLRLFNNVKNLRLCKIIAPRIARALTWLPEEQSMGVLPALENVFISRLESFGYVGEAISEFADARQPFGCPVSIHNWEGTT